MRRILFSFMLAFAVAGPGVSGVGTAEAAGAAVIFTDRANPATLTVAPGTRVTFANQSGERIRVRSEDGPDEFDSGNLEAGTSWSVVLGVPGTYPYVDDRDRDNSAYHGTITVTSAPPPAGGSPTTPAPGQPPAGSSEPSAPATASVSILDRSFSPAAVTIAPGGTVSWANQSDRDHTVTGSGFDSGVLGGGGRFSHTFPSAGTFTYICEIHPEMRASVNVASTTGSAQPGPSPAAPAAPAPAPAAPAPGTSAPRPQAPAAGGATAAKRHDVVLVDYAFRPTSISARVGDSVVWTNQGRAPHTATAAGAFDTGMFRAGEQRTTALRTPGTFNFACAIHPEMTGVLTLAAAGDGGAPAGSPGSPATPAPAAAGSPATTITTTAPVAAVAPETAEVAVIDFAFEPDTTRLGVGGTVTWRHNGVAPHTVTALDSSFDSGLLQGGGTFSHRFDRAGIFQYVCAYHPQMAGTIEITEAQPAAAPGDAGEQAAAVLTGAGEGASSPSGTAVLAALLGGAALLAGTGALLYGGSRMVAADDRP